MAITDYYATTKKEPEPGPFDHLTPPNAYAEIWHQAHQIMGALDANQPGQQTQLRALSNHLAHLLARSKDEAFAAYGRETLVRIYETLDDLESSDQAFDSYLAFLQEEEAEPADLIKALADRGHRLLKKGLKLKALGHFSRICQDFKDAPEAIQGWDGLVRYYLSIGEPQEAVPTMEHIVSTYSTDHPRVVAAYYNLSTIHTNQRDYKTAISRLEQLIARCDEERIVAFAELRIADLYRYQKQDVEAIRRYREVLGKYDFPSIRIPAKNKLASLQNEAFDAMLSP